MLRPITLPALAIVLLPACIVGQVGSGEPETQTRDIDGATSVTSATAVRVEIQPGAEQASLELTCDDNLIDDIITEVDDQGMLTVRTEPRTTLLPVAPCVARVALPAVFEARNTGSGGLEVLDDAPELGLVENSGSGAVSVLGLAGSLVEVVASGSGALEIDVADVPDSCSLDVVHTGSGRVRIGDVEACDLSISQSGSGSSSIAGRVSELDLDVSGSGGVKERDLVVDRADIGISGSGGVELTVRESVRARLSGSGGAVIHGSPDERDIQETGSGRVKFE